ncbi:MAG: MlaD family protein [Planctomycetia bacterium]
MNLQSQTPGQENSDCRTAAEPQTTSEMRNEQQVLQKLPIARITEGPESSPGMLRTSRLWWITAACVLLAGWLTWQSLPVRGPEITILFPDGHGLKQGDPLRYRGIDAGSVTSVMLNADLDRVVAIVSLTPAASALAREGARFWIVRPQISSAGITGLETAIGPRYIAVVPGPVEAPGRHTFEGLASTPPDHDGASGIDIVLRADAQHGVNPGAPVAWRGVQVGKILSVDLSPDARFVDLHARIDSGFRRLLGNTSKFWVTSGLEMNVGLSGVRMNAESLSTIVRGGVTFTTPALGETNSPINSGAIFRLYKEAEPGWTEALTSRAIVDFPIPPTITLQSRRRTSFLGFPRNETVVINGILIPDGEQTRLLTTADALFSLTSDGESVNPAEVAGTELITLGITDPSREKPTPVPVLKDAIKIPSGNFIGSVLIPNLPESLPIARLTVRVPSAPEDCILCRSVSEAGKPLSVVHPISRSELIAETRDQIALWGVIQEDHDLAAWHGAPVLSVLDGRLIGILVITDRGPSIVPVTETTAAR